MSAESEMVRHFLASIAYHATKAIRDAPEGYPELDIGKGVRTPRNILHHMTGVLTYAHSFYEDYETTYFDHEPWEEEVERFYGILSKLDESLSRAYGPAPSAEEAGGLPGPLGELHLRGHSEGGRWTGSARSDCT